MIRCGLPAALGVVLAMGAGLAAEQKVLVDITPAQQSYVAGEPIGLVLTVTNNTPHPVEILTAYPFFDGEMRVKPAPGYSGPQGVPLPHELESACCSSKALILPVSPGGSWQAKIFLQRFVGSVPPGAYQVEYTIRIIHRVELGGGGPRGNERQATGTGVFPLTVHYVSEEDTRRAIEASARGLGGTDWLARGASQEAVSVVDSPAAIPYLIRLSREGAAEQAILALEKFRGNSEAEGFVVERAHSARYAEKSMAIAVLAEWRYLVPENEFESWLANESLDVKFSALRYAEKVKAARYLPAVTARTSGANDGVAEQARLVAGELVHADR